MNPTLGLILPILLGQSPVVPASAAMEAKCAPCDVKGAPSSLPPPFQRGPYMGPSWSPPGVLCAPVAPPAPVLAMRAILPDGMAIQLDGTGTRYGTGSTFGFRPGYPYRFRIDVPNGEALGGSLEVRGSIIPRVNMKYMDYAAPIFVSKADVERVRAGGIVTKIIYLEDPTTAVPQEAKPDAPIEIGSSSEDDALREAEAAGRLAAIFRLGDRAPSQQELTMTYIPGTVLLPGATALGKPNVPPVPMLCVGLPLYDPILGPRTPAEECFVNGGDGATIAGIGPGNRVFGIDPTDVIAEYTSGNKRRLTTSNVVCICAPRFVTRRVEQGLGSAANRVQPIVLVQIVAKNIFDYRVSVEQYVGRERTLGVQSRTRPSIYVSLVALQALIGTEYVKINATTEGLGVLGTVVSPEEATAFPSLLQLTKSVTPGGPYQSGQVVTITLAYRNGTRLPISDLVISDALSPRLEYLPGTAAAEGQISNVTTSESDAGATTIRFDIPGPIRAGDSGKVVFQVKIR